MLLWLKKSHIAPVALGPRGSVYEPALAPPDQAWPRSGTFLYWTTGRPAQSFQLRTEYDRPPGARSAMLACGTAKSKPGFWLPARADVVGHWGAEWIPAEA